MDFGRSSSHPGAQGRRAEGLAGADEPGTDVAREWMLVKQTDAQRLAEEGHV